MSSDRDMYEYHRREMDQHFREMNRFADQLNDNETRLIAIEVKLHHLLPNEGKDYITDNQTLTRKVCEKFPNCHYGSRCKIIHFKNERLHEEVLRCQRMMNVEKRNVDRHDDGTQLMRPLRSNEKERVDRQNEGSQLRLPWNVEKDVDLPWNRK